MTAGEIQRRIEELVLERESLHDAGAGHDELEANRREIVRLEHELSAALIAEHTQAA
jgi:hypothetical protein